MITLILSSVREKKTTSFPPTHVLPTNYPFISVNPMYKELERRNDIIKKLFNECPYKEGDTCIPTTDKDIEQYGEVNILNMCSSITEYGKHEAWPKSDNPMIVTGFSHKKQTTFFCTTNFLKKV